MIQAEVLFLFVWFVPFVSIGIGCGYVMKAKGYGWGWLLIGAILPPLGVIVALGMPLDEVEQARRELAVRDIVERARGVRV